jgi:hypothetical protein
MRPQPASPFLLLGLLFAVCLLRPAAHDGLALAPMQSTAWSDATERSAFTRVAGRRATACPYGQRYSSFYGKCVRWWVPQA